MRIGILAVQGDYEAHARVLERLGAEYFFVRTAADLARADALGRLQLLRVHGEASVAEGHEHRDVRPRQLRADGGAQPGDPGGREDEEE